MKIELFFFSIKQWNAFEEMRQCREPIHILFFFWGGGQSKLSLNIHTFWDVPQTHNWSDSLLLEHSKLSVHKRWTSSRCLCDCWTWASTKEIQQAQTPQRSKTFTILFFRNAIYHKIKQNNNYVLRISWFHFQPILNRMKNQKIVLVPYLPIDFRL